MKSATTPLLDLLNSGIHFAMADLFAFELVGGGVQRYTGADIDLVWAANRYRSVAIRRSKIREQIGVNVDELTVEMSPGAELVNGVAMIHAARTGLFDGARVTLMRAFLPSWSAGITGTLLRFSGRVSEIEPSRSMVRFLVRSDLELLDVKLPRRLYQTGCLHTLFDGGCGLTKSAFAVAGAVDGTSTTSAIDCNLTQAAGYFSLGTVTFTSGANSGQSRSVKAYSPGSLVLASPLPTQPISGDTFNAYPGCDKTLSTCQTKFSNKPNFRGHPYIPKPETAF